MVYNTQNHWISGLRPSSGFLNTRKNVVLETGSVPSWGEKWRHLLGSVARAKGPNRVGVSLPHLSTETSSSRKVVYLEFRTMDKVQTPSDSQYKAVSGLIYCLTYSSTLKIEAIFSSKPSVGFSWLHVFISQQTEFFIITAVRTSNRMRVFHICKASNDSSGNLQARYFVACPLENYTDRATAGNRTRTSGSVARNSWVLDHRGGQFNTPLNSINDLYFLDQCYNY
jgi:hypothetical protein